MNKLVIIYFILLLFSSCSSTIEIKDDNSESTDLIKEIKPIQEENTTNMIMTTSGNIEPSNEVKLYGCDFTIVLNNLGDTTHWSTNDKNFITPEGFKIGTNLNELPIELRNTMDKMIGWGYYIKLNSEWQLGFCEGSSCTDTKPKEESSVKWIFKRNE